MKKQIQGYLGDVSSLDDVKIALIKLLENLKEENPNTKIGYVAGIISSDGPENIKQNVTKLAAFTDKIRKTHDFPVFSSTDVISSEVFDKIKGKTYKQASWRKFWREILESGHITDIFITPRWQKSTGAADEHKIARKLGLKIHYI